MRVAIDGRAIGSGRGGDETYTTALLAGLAAAAGEEDSFPLYLPEARPVPDAVAADQRFPVHRLRQRSELVRYTRTLPRAVRRAGADVLHCLTFAPPVGGSPLAIQVTDLSFVHHPGYFAPTTRLRLNLLVPYLARRARVVMTLSEFCRRDLVGSFGLDEERVFVVPIGIAVRRPEPAAIGAALRRLGVEAPYFLYLGNRHPRKNLARLVRAFREAARLSPEVAAARLVLAGAPWWGAGEEEREAALAAPGSVVFLGPIGDADRDALLAGATGLLYPSLFEGFGLPPLEAMAVGTPVMASDRTAIPEVCGEAALLVDPEDVGAMARAIARLASDRDLRGRLSAAGRRRAAGYTSRTMGERAMTAFRAAAGRGARTGTGRRRPN